MGNLLYLQWRAARGSGYMRAAPAGLSLWITDPGTSAGNATTVDYPGQEAPQFGQYGSVQGH